MNDAGLAIAASVAMHVVWNLIARHQPGSAFPLWWVLLGHLVLVGPWGFYMLLSGTEWSPRLVGLLLISALGNVFYFWGLRHAYAHAPVALVYPLVRGSPLLIAVWSVLFLGEELSASSWTGIVISVIGLWIMAASTNHGADRRALPWAALAMFSTSIYSLSDKAATSQIETFGGLVGFLSVGYLASWLFLSWELRSTTGAWFPPRCIHGTAMVVGGLCVGLAYALVIHAMRTLPSAEVVAYTNAGIVIASLLSIIVFREYRAWRRRLVAALVISLGLVIMYP